MRGEDNGRTEWGLRARSCCPTEVIEKSTEVLYSVSEEGCGEASKVKDQERLEE